MHALTIISTLLTCILFNFTNTGIVIASTTSYWTQSTYEELAKGDANNVAVCSNGTIELSPETKNIEGINASYIWCMTTDKAGKVFAGTGNPGYVYQISDKKKAVIIFEAPEGVQIQSIVTDNHGNVYAGTSPNGLIYKITREMNAKLFCRLPELYVWDMAIDYKGRLYAATGNQGRIYKISPDGEAEVILDSKATHILDLEIDKNNTIYACTEPFGLIYKINGKEISVVYDADEDEVHCLTLDSNGILYAGACYSVKSIPPQLFGMMGMTGHQQRKPPKDLSEAFQGGGLADFGLVDDYNNDDMDTPNPDDIKDNKSMPDFGLLFNLNGLPMKPNCIYRISQNKGIEKVMELEHSFVFSLIPDEENNIYAGTSNNASIYKIGSNHKHSKVKVQEDITTLFDSKHAQILSLTKVNGKGFYVGTGNNGTVYKVSNDHIAKGEYISTVHDAKVKSKWGRISWNPEISSGTKIELFTRTGNNEKPDAAWNSWKKTKLSPEDINNEIIESPNARFIQYKAVLSTIDKCTSPALGNITISYLQDNQSHSIKSVEIDNLNNVKSGVKTKQKKHAKTKSARTSTPKDNKRKKGFKKIITWELANPDNDHLLFNLYAKKTKERFWRIIASNLQDQRSYTWNIDNVDNEEYHVKIIASDILSNQPEDEMQAEIISQRFPVDNKGPEIKITDTICCVNGNFTVNGTVSDDISNISEMRYSIDSKNWFPIFPTDQLFDYKKEDFQFTMPKLPVIGNPMITISARDAEGNRSTQEVHTGQ